MTGIFETAGDIVEKIDTVVDSIPETISVFAIDNFNLIMLVFSAIVFGSAFIFLFRLAKEIIPSEIHSNVFRPTSRKVFVSYNVPVPTL